MRNATPTLPFKMRRPTHRHYFLRVNFRPFSFFTCTMRAKISPAHEHGIFGTVKLCTWNNKLLSFMGVPET